MRLLLRKIYRCYFSLLYCNCKKILQRINPLAHEFVKSFEQNTEQMKAWIKRFKMSKDKVNRDKKVLGTHS